MTPNLLRIVNGKTYRLCREYIDLKGNPRIAVFLEEGPAGKRWLMEDASILTIDWVERTHYKPFRGKLFPYAKRPWDPWSAARNIKDSWVIEE